MGTLNKPMGVCESTEDNEDDSQYSAAAVSTSGALSRPSEAVFEMECHSDPSRRLKPGESYDLCMDAKTLNIKDGNDVVWSLSYFDIIAWGSSSITFKIVLKQSKLGKSSTPRSATPKGQKEPTFDVKFYTSQGKKAAVTIRTFCLDLLDDMTDAEADKKIAEQEKQWEQILHRPKSETNPAERTEETLDELDMMSISTVYGSRPAPEVTAQ